MEARLSTHTRHELSRLLTGQLDDVRHDLSNANGQFESTRALVCSVLRLFITSFTSSEGKVPQRLKISLDFDQAPCRELVCYP